MKEVDALLRSAYELKWLGTIGDEEGESKQVHFLNRLIRCEQHQGASAILIEPDRRHVDLLVQQLGMQNAKGAETPDVKKSVELQMQEARSPALPKDQASPVSILRDEGRILVSGQVGHQSCCEESCEKDGLAYRGILAGFEATVSLPHPETGRVSGVCQAGKAEQTLDPSGLGSRRRCYDEEIHYRDGCAVWIACAEA